MRFFDYDGPFNQFIMKMVDLFLLSILWFITSTPIITIGASTDALFFAINKVIRQEEGGVWKTYWRAFLRDFWQATLIWLILLLFYGSSLMAYFTMLSKGSGPVARGFLIAVVLIVTLWTQYWYPYLSRFVDSTKTLLRNTLIMLLLDFFRSLKLLILAVLAVAVAVAAFIYSPIMLVLLPGFYVFLANRTMDKVFSKYLPEPEEGTEDVEMEEEQ